MIPVSAGTALRNHESVDQNAAAPEPSSKRTPVTVLRSAAQSSLVRAWIVLLLAPNIGGVCGGLLASTLGISERSVLAESTSGGDVFRAVGLVAGGAVGGFLLLRERGRAAVQVTVPAEALSEAYWFPGRWVGGLTLIVSPLLLVAGELLRIKYHFYFPQQLAAFSAQPGLMLASYSLYTLGLVLLVPAFLTLAHFIGRSRPGWALWGGALAVVGAIGRVFHEGINHLAFQLVDAQGVTEATRVVGETYQAWYVLYPLTFADNLGWTVLAIGAYRSRTLGWVPALAVTAMLGHSSGVLKGSDLGLVLEATALCCALIPLGVAMIRGTRPRARGTKAWATVAGLGAVLLYGYHLIWVV